MKYIVLLGLCFLNIPFVFSQNNYQASVDSLYTLIVEENNETKKIGHYVRLCAIYEEYDFKRFIKCNEELLTIVKKVKSKQGYGYYYLNKSKVSDLQNNISQAIIEVQKSRQLFYAIKDWDNYLYSSSILGNYFSNNGYYEKCELLMTQLWQMPFTNANKRKDALYYASAFLYYSSGEYNKALQFTQKLLSNENTIIKKEVLYNLIANIHRRMANYDKAFEYNKIANTYAKSLTSIYNVLYTKNLILSQTNQPKEALKLALDCMKYYKEQNWVRLIWKAQFQISYLYGDIGNYKKANYYMDEVLKYPSSGSEYQIDIYALKTNICLRLGDIKTAKLFAQKTLSLVDSVSFNMKIIGYNTKIELEKALGDYKQVAFYYEKKCDLMEQKYDNDHKNKLHQLEIDLDITEKKNSIKALKIEQLKKQMEISNKNSYLLYVSILLLIAVFSTLIYVRDFNIIKTKNLIIENEKLLVKKTLAEKETMLREIHHRVKNNLQLVMSLLYLQSTEKGKNMDDFIEISQSRIISMSLIHENLYNTDDLSKVDFKKYLHKLSDSIINSNGNLTQNIQVQIDMEDLYFDIQTAIPLGLIINELITNAYKHAFVNRSEGIIHIAMKQKDDDYEIIIKDNGVGMTEKEISKNTLGQELVKQLVNQINGVLKIKNDLGMQYIIHFKN